MGEFQPRLEHIVSIWWLTRWRLAAGAFAASMPLIVIIAGVSIYVSGPVVRAMSAGFEIALAVILFVGSFIVDGMALKKRYMDFRIALLPLEGGSEIPPTRKETAAFWWLLTWRGLVGILLIDTVLALVLLKPLTALGFSSAGTLVTAVGFAAAIAWEVLVMRMAIAKRYRHFRIALIEEVRPEGDEPAPQR